MFDWDDFNIDHIAEHNVSPEEAEEAVLDPDRIVTEAYSLNKEKRKAMVGKTLDGRYLTVILTVRNALFRVITARDSNATEKRRFRK
jgi:uncharacterized DUF497 family protein